MKDRQRVYSLFLKNQKIIFWAFVLFRVAIQLLFMTGPKYGLGVSSDSVDYMFTGLQLARGSGFVSFDNAPYTLWPPLYPILLALFTLGGASPLLSAAIWQVLFVIGFVILTTFWLKSTLKNWLIVIGIAILNDLSLIHITALQMVGSDALFVLFSLTALFFGQHWLQTQGKKQKGWFALTWLFLALSMLQRYIGVLVLLWFLLQIVAVHEKRWSDRLKAAFWMSLSALPLLFWLLRNMILKAAAFGERKEAVFGLLENLQMGVFALSRQWFFNGFLPEPWLVVLIFISLGLLLGASMVLACRKREWLAFSASGFGLVYGAGLLIIASLVYFNQLIGRFWLPLVFPLFFSLGYLLVHLFKLDADHSGWKGLLRLGVVIVILGLIGWSMLETSYKRLLQAQKTGEVLGNEYNDVNWQESDLIQYWRHFAADHSDAVYYGNIPAGFAFTAWQEVFDSPRKSTPSHRHPVYALTEDAFGESQDPCERYLLWYAPNYFVHVYPLRTLQEAFPLTMVYESEEQRGYIFEVYPSE